MEVFSSCFCVAHCINSHVLSVIILYGLLFRDFKLLSFGDEAEEEEEIANQVSEVSSPIGHITIGIIQSKSDRLFNTQSRFLQAYWLILENML